MYNACIVSLQLDWKPARITDLVEHLRDVVRLQYNELRRALCGLGEFQLAPAFTHHGVTQMQWSAMTEDARERAVEKLLKDNGARDGPAQRTVTSTDEQLTVTGSPRIARKKGQRRRPIAERTANKQ